MQSINRSASEVDAAREDTDGNRELNAFFFSRRPADMAPTLAFFVASAVGRCTVLPVVGATVELVGIGVVGASVQGGRCVRGVVGRCVGWPVGGR